MAGAHRSPSRWLMGFRLPLTRRFLNPTEAARRRLKGPGCSQPAEGRSAAAYGSAPWTRSGSSSSARVSRARSPLSSFSAATSGCAALSAHEIHSLILPPNAKRVRIFADHDELGQGFIAAREAWGRWRAEGRHVAVTVADNVGEDANDVLTRRLRGAA